VNKTVGTLRSYPQISKWLGPWLQQLGNLGDVDHYRVILSEVEELQSGIAHQEHDHNLKRTDYHLYIASTVCKNFELIFSEKRQLGRDVHEANARILDKLAEIRAVVGLHRLGFDDIEFTKAPDLSAILEGKRFLVEVTRLGASIGKRSQGWDSEWGSLESGAHMGLMVSGGKSVDAVSDAIYREIEGKYPQLKKSKHEADGMILWISLGRDYLTAGLYELPYVGPLVRMSNAKKALDVALRQIRSTGLYDGLCNVVLSRGRDNSDLVLPQLTSDG
jgi:hypothetical protein